MATTYQELINAKGTIYNKTTGKGYATPAELATDLGIQPHLIDWTKIGTGEIPQAPIAAPIFTPTSTTPTPQKQAEQLYKDESGKIWSIPPEEVSHRARVQGTTYTPYSPDYSGLVNVSGTIYDKTTGKGYATPEELTTTLGLPKSDFIDWTKIGTSNVIPGSQPPPTPKTDYGKLINVGGEVREKESGKAYSSPTELAGALGTQPHQIDWSKIVADIDTEANDAQDKELEFIRGEVGTKVDLSKSASLMDKITGLLEDRAKQPEAPSFEQKLLEKRENLGLTGLETDLAGMDAKIKQLDADFASSIEGEEQRQVSMGQIRRRQSAEEVAYNRQKRDLIVERDSIANQLNMKYGVINTAMKYAGMDYDNAQQNYQSQLTNSINLINLLRGVQQEEKTDLERKTDNARANSEIMYNLIKSGNVSYDNLDASTKLNIKNVEIQAGLPVGFTQFISETIDAPKVSFLSAYTDESGMRVQPVGTIDANGKFSITNVNIGQAEEPGNITGEQSVSKAEFKEALENRLIPVYPSGFVGPKKTLTQDFIDKAYAEYFEGLKAKNANLKSFTKEQLMKLEQAGLLNTTRKEQLDYLYGNNQEIIL